MILCFPFVFYNNGPLPFIIQNLQVVFVDETPQIPMAFIATVPQLEKDEGRTYATPFPIRAREAISIICECQRSLGGFIFESQKYNLELQARLNDSKEWKAMLRFQLNLTKIDAEMINKSFSVHDNLE